MKVLDKYIAASILQGTALTLLMLTLLMGFIDFVSESGDIGRAQYGLWDVFLFVILNLPKRIYDIFPTAVLLGSMMSLGSLASNSELMVMRASGVSISRIVWSVLKTGFLLAIIAAFLGETIVPPTERAAQSLRAVALQKNISIGGKYNLWVKDQNRYINVQLVYPDKRLVGIEIHEIDDQRNLVSSTLISKAAYKKPLWELHDVVRSEFTENGIQISRQAKTTSPILLDPELFEVVTVKPQSMSATDLHKYSDYLDSNDLDSGQYHLAFWIKIFTPLSSLVMLMIALPFVLRTTSRSSSAGARLITGLMLGIGFFLLNRGMNHLGLVYGIPPFLSALIPLLLVAMAATLALKKVF